MRKAQHFILALVVLFSLGPSLPVVAAEYDLIVFGDSLTTGAATHPNLAYDSANLWDAFAGRIDLTAKASDLPEDLGFSAGQPLKEVARLWPAKEEFYGGLDWVWRHSNQIMARRYIDRGEYTWGYFLGAKLGYPGDRVAIAGEDGAQIHHFSSHIARVKDANLTAPPKKVVAFYTGNDICALSTQDFTAQSDFAEQLTNGLKKLMQTLPPAKAGEVIDIYVPAYLSVAQLIYSDAILNKPITAYGQQTTCRELRQNLYAPKVTPSKPRELAAEHENFWNLFTHLMPPNPAEYCPTLFRGVGAEKEKDASAVANQVRLFRATQERVVSTLAQEAARQNSSFRLHYLPSTGTIEFTGDEIAVDCFHLSIAGQARVAKAIYQDMQRNQ